MNEVFDTSPILGAAERLSTLREQRELVVQEPAFRFESESASRRPRALMT